MYLLEDLQNENYKKYSKSNLPLKYINYNISDFKILGNNSKEKNHNQKMFDLFMEYYNNLENNLKNGIGMIICGSVGIGKTLLTTCLAKKIIEIFDSENLKIQNEDIGDNAKYNKFYYIQATSLSQMIFTSGLNEKELSIRRGIKSISGLCIDDISKIQETKTSVEISFFDDIIRCRDLNKLTTIFTSQLPFDELQNVLSRPIVDIISGNSIQITFRGDSQRKI